MNSDIKLRKADEPEPERNTLPRGVRALILNERVYFVRRVAGRFMPLPEHEQKELRRKHVV